MAMAGTDESIPVGGCSVHHMHPLTVAPPGSGAVYSGVRGPDGALPAAACDGS